MSAPISELASSSAHAINNILSALYTASGFLEQVDGPIASRAEAAVGRAISAGRALSCALYLNSLTEADLSVILSASSYHVLLDNEYAEKLSMLLREVARVEFSRAVMEPPARRLLKVDADTLEALLVCGAFLQRRESGSEAKLVARLVMAPESPSPVAEFIFEDPSKAMESNMTKRPYQHPCGIALTHAAMFQRALGIDVRVIESGGLAIRIPASGEQLV